MSKQVINLGPHRILTAPSVEDIFANWTDIGATRGDIVVTVDSGKVALSRVDQHGITPLSESVFRLGHGIQVTFPLVSKSIDKLLKVSPNSVKESDGGFDALGFGSRPSFVTPVAFVLIPEFVYAENDVNAIWKSNLTTWIREGYIMITGEQPQGLPEGSDDVLSDYALECQLMQVADTAHPYVGGWGPLFALPDNPIYVMGSNNPTQLAQAVPDSQLQTELNGVSITTVAEMYANTAAIDFSGTDIAPNTISDASGIEYLAKTTSINLAWNALTTVPNMENMTQLVTLDLSDNSITVEDMSTLVGQLWKIREELGANNATLSLDGNNGLNAEATEQVEGTGKYLNEGLTDYGVTVTY